MEKTKSRNGANCKRGSLFLQGVFVTDCQRMEDMFHDRLLTDYQEHRVIYKPLPPLFNNVESWLRSTNLLCCYCSRSFNTRPWFEPQSIEPISTGRVGCLHPPTHLSAHTTPTHTQTHSSAHTQTHSSQLPHSSPTSAYNVVVKYVFCSENCTAAFILKNTPSLAERNNKMAMLRYVYYMMCGVSISEIGASPDPTIMVQYGGSITPNEYQQRINEIRSLSKQRKIVEDFDSLFDLLCS